MPDKLSIVYDIRRSLRWLVAATVVLFVALAVLAFVSWNTADKNGDALCNLRADVEKRVATSKTFLEEHPRGVGGISAATIRQSIINGQSTINSLSGLNCG